MTPLAHGILIGVGATAFLDLVAYGLHRGFGMPKLNYDLLGRWGLWCLGGRFAHDTIQRSPPRAGEMIAGWVLHYLIGVGIVLAMLSVTWPGWARSPDLLTALATGIVSMLLPFLIAQPLFGFGVAGARTPDPWKLRRRALVTHVSFGLGIYVAALALAAL